jgi:hypothetical protein
MAVALALPHYEYCANSLSRSFPYESLSLLVNNHITQVALDLVRVLVPSQEGYPGRKGMDGLIGEYNGSW